MKIGLAAALGLDPPLVFRAVLCPAVVDTGADCSTLFIGIKLVSIHSTGLFSSGYISCFTVSVLCFNFKHTFVRMRGIHLRASRADPFLD